MWQENVVWWNGDIEFILNLFSISTTLYRPWNLGAFTVRRRETPPDKCQVLAELQQGHGYRKGMQPLVYFFVCGFASWACRVWWWQRQQQKYHNTSNKQNMFTFWALDPHTPGLGLRWELHVILAFREKMWNNFPNSKIKTKTKKHRPLKYINFRWRFKPLFFF